MSATTAEIQKGAGESDSGAGEEGIVARVRKE